MAMPTTEHEVRRLVWTIWAILVLGMAWWLWLPRSHLRTWVISVDGPVCSYQIGTQAVVLSKAGLGLPIESACPAEIPRAWGRSW